MSLMTRRKQEATARSRMRSEEGNFEYVFLAIVAMGMLALGVVMVFSASLARAYFENQDGYYYLKRELFFAAWGVVAMFLMARYDFTRLRKLAPVLMAIAMVLLFVVLIPGVGISVNGARRWLGAGQATFQPAEFAKLAVILFAAAVMSSRPRLLVSLKDMALPVLAIPVAACFLVLLEPDMGTAITLSVTLAGMLLVAGVSLRVLALPAMGAAFLFLLSVFVKPHQMDRITAFLDPWQDPSGTGHQIIQSWVAIGSGGMSGVGLGQSVQKFNYLPESHTDMIFSIISEETGILGALLVVGGFIAFAYIGFRIALNCRYRFGKYVAAGITSMLVGQAAINLCAVTGLLPLTGVPLPLVSYGGSSLIVVLASIGILLNIAVNPRGKIAAAPQRKNKAVESRDRGRRDGRAPGAGARSRRRAHG
ncbi:MAG: putative lipid II flippase FtsW [Actinobacteria bacterium]|nr:putative lipid II flippase FtsW [Actinomycetota bacterium]